MNRTMASYWLAIVMAERVLKIVPSGTHDWEDFVTPSELENILAKRIFFLKYIRQVILILI